MAIGCARIFGFRLAPNFNNPYLKTNPQDFWNSWHMSLTRFAQRNVFVPMGGMRARTQYVAIVATMMVIALWHDLSIPLVIFGIYHSTGLVLHRLWTARRPVPRPQPAAEPDRGQRRALRVRAGQPAAAEPPALRRPDLLREALLMVVVDAFLAWLRRVVGYVPTPWSLLRIAVFTAVVLLLARSSSRTGPGRPGPRRTTVRSPRRTTRNVTLPLNDTRGFKPTPQRKTFRVAWVGGSELLGVRPGHGAFIPRLVNDQIGKRRRPRRPPPTSTS